jgi:hypothetical protein
MPRRRAAREKSQALSLPGEDWQTLPAAAPRGKADSPPVTAPSNICRTFAGNTK